MSSINALFTEKLIVRKRTPRLVALRNKITQYYRQSNSNARTLPDYIIIGAAKAGTTSLYNYLCLHPDVLPAYKKEVHYFDYNYNKGQQWYRSHFPLKKQLEPAGGARVITGEATPYYMFHPLVPKRLAEVLPNTKLICMLRNPVDRALSSYYNQHRMGFEKLYFKEAFEQESERLEGEEELIIKDQDYFSYNHKYYSYIQRGVYVNQLERWFQYFPKESLQVIASEQFYQKPDQVYQEVTEFLGLEPLKNMDFKVHNAGGDYTRMDKGLRSRLIDYYKPFNERLYQLLGRRFEWD